MVVRRQIAAMLNVVMRARNAVVHRRNVAILNVAMLRLRLNVALVHQRIVAGAHVRYRGRRHASNRVTISVRQRHRRNVRRDRHSSDRRLSASRDRFESNDLRLGRPNDRRRDQRSGLNDRRLRESSGHGHSRADRRHNRTNRRRNRA